VSTDVAYVLIASVQSL